MLLCISLHAQAHCMLCTNSIINWVRDFPFPFNDHFSYVECVCVRAGIPSPSFFRQMCVLEVWRKRENGYKTTITSLKQTLIMRLFTADCEKSVAFISSVCVLDFCLFWVFYFHSTSVSTLHLSSIIALVHW